MTLAILGTDVHEYLVTITGTTDDTYEILIDGVVAGTFVASGSTAEEIRDGLLATLNATNDAATGDALDTDKIVVRDPGRPLDADNKLITGTKTNTGFTSTVTGTDITIAEQDGFADGEDLIFTDALTVTPGNFPRDGIQETDEDPVKAFSIRGFDDSSQVNSRGHLQAVITLNGTANTFIFNYQMWGEEHLS